MNRNHLGILYSAIALLLIFSVFLRLHYVTEQQSADRTTESALQFAISNSLGKLNISYGSANDYHTLSDTFFQSLSLLQDKRAILDGRLVAEDYYPFVPLYICLEERYYHIGSFDGTTYQWSETQYYPNYALLSETNLDIVITTIETQINNILKQYHDTMGLPDINYIIPDHLMREIQTPSILVVLENFPTNLYGHYYSGVFHGSGNLIPIT